MNRFEDDLRNALRREDPPAGFSARVLARTRFEAPRRAGWVVAGLAACLLLSAGELGYRQYEGRKAKRELLQALEIAGSKLSVAQEKVFHLNRRTIHE